MNAEEEKLLHSLKDTAVCGTEHPAMAAALLVAAAGEILHHVMGVDGAVAVLRKVIDDTEALMLAKHGRRSGEAVQ